jgi:hypothetical protein
VRDPHVVSLRYRLVVDESSGFENAVPLDGESPQFRYHLEADMLVLDMKEHYGLVAEARDAVGAWLRAWEVADGLDRGSAEFRFVYDSAEVVDRDPPPPGTIQSLSASVHAFVRASDSARLQVNRSEYPQPPTGFQVSPDVETMLWRRYEGYREGKEPLLAMAYFCLTLLEERASGAKHSRRPKAARRLNIENAILDRLATWAANRGGEATARKLRAGSQLDELTASEVRWVEAAVRALIRREGKWSGSPADGHRDVRLASGVS